jgi:hypothetical protein
VAAPPPLFTHYSLQRHHHGYVTRAKIDNRSHCGRQHIDFPDRKMVEKYGGGLDLLEFAPEHIAQQLTLIEYAIFRRIKPVELTDQSWSKRPVSDLNLLWTVQSVCFSV